MTARPTVSVLTLVRHRQLHLDNLVTALSRQNCARFELIVASMQADPPAVASDTPFPVRIVSVQGGERLPLSAARNRAAAAAEADSLVFLDVDCIPAPALVGNYGGALKEWDCCFLGEVRYLSKLDTPAPGNFKKTWEIAKNHPARPPAPDSGWRTEPDPRQLWGLSFGLRAERYRAVDGMDEAFVGYGGEETDFAERLARVGTRFAWLANARAVHQWHSVCSPPLDKFRDIVCNAQRFRDRWGSWCMESWLQSFADAGYVDWTLESESIRVRRVPARAEIERSRQPDHVCFA